MERSSAKTFFTLVKILLITVCIVLGLFFTLETYLCLNVDGVHVLGYTVMPALALIFFTLAWLLLRYKKRPGADAPDDEYDADSPGNAR